MSRIATPLSDVAMPPDLHAAGRPALAESGSSVEVRPYREQRTSFTLTDAIDRRRAMERVQPK